MCFAYILPIQFGKFQRILKSLANSLNISVEKGIFCACRVVHMAQMSKYTFILIAATINRVS